MLRSGEGGGSQLQHESKCFRQQGMKRGRITEVYIPYYVVLWQGWGSGEVWGGGEAEREDVVGSKFGLSQIPPIAHLTKVYLLC